MIKVFRTMRWQQVFIFFLFFTSIHIAEVYAQTHEVADNYWREAELAVEKKDYKKATKLFEKISEAALVNKKLKNYETAKSIYLRALEGFRKYRDTKNEIYLILLSDFADLHYTVGDYEESIPYYSEWFQTIEENNLEKSDIYYSNKEKLIESYGNTSQFQLNKVVPLYIDLLDFSKRTKGIVSLTYINYLNELAIVYKSAGQTENAIILYEDFLNSTEAVVDSIKEYDTLLNNLAITYKSDGNYKKALFWGLKSVKLTKNRWGEKSSNHVKSLNNVGTIYYEMAQYDKAIEYFQNTLEIAKNNLKPNDPEYLSILNNLGLVFSRIGRFEAALPLLEEALKNSDTEDFSYIGRLNNIATLYFKLKMYDKAEQSISEGKLKMNKQLEKKPLLVLTESETIIKLFNNDIYLLKIFGIHDEAILSLINLKELIKIIYGDSHPRFITCLNNLAHSYHVKGDFEKALPIYHEVLSITNQYFGDMHPHYFITSNNLAALYRSKKNNLEAYNLLMHALEILRKQIQAFFSFQSENDKEKYIDDSNIYFNEYQSSITDFFDELPLSSGMSYDIELLTKGLILSSSEQIRRVMEQSDNAGIKKKYEDWLQKRSFIARQYAIAVNSRDKDLKKWEEEAENIERELVKHSNQYKEALQLGRTAWQDIQAALQENQVTIEFASFKYNNSKEWTDSTLYTALIVKKGFERPILVPLFEQRQLDSLLVSGGSDASRVAGLYRGSEAKSTTKNHKKLYDLIWKPLEAHLNKNETIYFAPSGSLHQIAFSAIVTPDGKYLSDKYTLNQVNTTAKFLHTPKAGDFSNISLFGGIDYTTPQQDLLVQAEQLKNDAYVSRSLTTDLQRGTESWNYLPGTLTEVNAIKEIAGKAGVSVKYFTGKTALEEHFKQQSGKVSPAILHIATHGFFFPDPEKQYKENQLLREAEKNVYKLSDNPLNRSGLLFSGANTAWKGEQVAEGLEDGILTAYEASNVSLTNTRLVVLSACETGLGDIKGSEGVFGLQRAFKLAGAEYLLMSLWKVPDAETAEFMEKFYQGLFASRDIEKSYRETQQYMKEKYPKEPYKWAAFVLMR